MQHILSQAICTMLFWTLFGINEYSYFVFIIHDHCSLECGRALTYALFMHVLNTATYHSWQVSSLSEYTAAHKKSN